MPQLSLSRLEQYKVAQKDAQTDQLDGFKTDREEASTTSQDEKPAISTPLSGVESDEKSYSAFSQIQKSIILVTVGLAGAASTLSSSIYLPALTAIQEVSFCSFHTIADLLRYPDFHCTNLSL